MSKRTRDSDDEAGAPQPARPKFVIQPHPFLKDRDVPTEADRAIVRLEAAFHSILKGVTSASFEELYRDGYNLVLAKYGDTLYRSVETHLAIGADYLSRRGTHKQFVKYYIMVRDIVHYMDRTYVIAQNKTPVATLALDAWQKRCNVKKRMVVRARIIGRLSLNCVMWNEARFAPGMLGAIEGLEHWVANGGLP
tara:strand:- start:39 stop:620 length:582 start_codon:yes stop_codon:yes gene_type:complete